jgi:hypothetical protein
MRRNNFAKLNPADSADSKYAQCPANIITMLDRGILTARLIN